MRTSLRWSLRSSRWLIPSAALLALIGYFGPWVGHPAAGLVVTGLDLGEYVKFLPSIVGGALTVWRQAFYLPLLAVSLVLSSTAFRAEIGYGWPMRVLLLAIATISALNMLPPAWTPQRMVTPEFRMQAMAIVFCLLAVGFSPFLALIQRKIYGASLAALALLGLLFPLWGFGRVLTDITLIYHRTQRIAWGPYVMAIGLILITVVGLACWFSPHGDGQLGGVGHEVSGDTVAPG